MAYVSTTSAARNGFWQILRSEWAKFWSVPAGWALLVSVVLGGVLFLVNQNDQTPQPNAWSHHLAHRPLSGDGTVVARVLEYDLGNPRGAAAGVMVTAGTGRTAPHAVLFLTPDRGVWLQSFRTEIAGTRGTGTPRWLKLARVGEAITGYESADGVTWNAIGTIRLSGLPERVEAGLITAGGWPGTLGTARFDNVEVATVGPGPTTVPGPAAWRVSDVGVPTTPGGSLTEAAGVLTMTGSGDFGSLAAAQVHSSVGEDTALGLLILELPVVMALGVLAATSEYPRGMIRTTFTASPRRGKVLAAKAVVFGVTVFAAELALLTFAVGWTAGHAEELAVRPFSLFDPWALRLVYGPALILTALALLGLGVGAIVRRAAGAIMLAAALLVGPPILAQALPGAVGMWTVRLAPAFSGLSLLNANNEYVTVPPPTKAELAALSGRDPGPDAGFTLFGIDYLPSWVGFGVLCAWAVAAFGVAYWRLRRRDV